jgi:putative membrane protein insertion efficiency factor
MIKKMAVKTLRKTLLALIVIYQNTLSLTFGPCCRFHPSCSSYAIESIERFGIRKGVWLSFRRLIRCHPFSPGGFDPVTGIKKNR